MGSQIKKIKRNKKKNSGFNLKPDKQEDKKPFIPTNRKEVK